MMAYSPSPQPSPTLAVMGARSKDQIFTPTPPPIPLSKRDKRRSVLSEKLNELTTSFANNRDSHYRQQLQALQIDLNLIMRADPYRDAPLDDSGDDIAELVLAAMGGNAQSGVNGVGAVAGPPMYPRPDKDVAALAGRWYAQYVEEINDAVEVRDTHLTMLENRYERALHEVHQHNLYKIKLAQEEHRALAQTLRERLIQSVGQKKARLMREKEHLDLADSNALLLHPNQFSITNPASPGGAGNGRKTRHTRHRPDVDDVGAGFSGADSGHKRKRKAAFDDLDNGSPAPPTRGLETGFASPSRDARARIAVTQSEAPLYSVERLFTEKELLMNLNHAHVAAHNYFTNLKNHPDGEKTKDGAGSLNAEDEDATGSGEAGTGADGEGEDDAMLAAPEMDRTANTSHHATRSTRNGAASALSLLGDLATSEKNNAAAAGANNIILPSSHITKTMVAPPPPALRLEEQEDDLARIERMMRAGPAATDEKLLQELVAPLGTSTYHKDLIPTLAAEVVTPASGGAPGVKLTNGGVPMSAQSSMAGTSETGLGGVAMSRVGEGSSMGVMMMKRSASGAGMGSQGDGKRARNR